MPDAQDGAVDLATRAYVYGFPLVFDLEQVDRITSLGLGVTPAAPFNTFSHATTLAGPQDTFVSINNDTIYSIAQLDLGGGPLLLTVPDTAGAYYVLQFVDAWTNNFAYVGKRATGTGAGRFLLTPPGWDGTVPGNTTRIAVPTRVASVVGRWACDGPADVGRVRDLQSGLSLAPADPAAPPAAGLPVPDPAVPPELRFWEKLRVWMAAFPPAGHDQQLQQAFGPLGLLEAGDSPYRDSPGAFAALAEGERAGRAALEQALRSAATPDGGSWQQNYHVFDYNVDFFEVGTINAPEWKIADRAEAITARAAAALAGLWGNHAYEAAYAQTWVDSDGSALHGSHDYRWRLDPEPPVAAFWSITMYDLPEFYLVENPIARYSIGDRTRGLVRGADGSIDIWISHKEPADPQAAANWLPAPAGEFRPILRMYSPRPEVLDGSYRVPPLVCQRLCRAGERPCPAVLSAPRGGARAPHPGTAARPRVARHRARRVPLAGAGRRHRAARRRSHPSPVRPRPRQAARPAGIPAR